MRPTGPEANAAQRFGALVERLAIAAGFDMERGKDGRKRLAEETGMSVSAIGRMVRGETLPDPGNYQRIARALNVTTRSLLLEADVLPRRDEAIGANQDVRSVINPVSPETAADMLGITNPIVRKMLIANIQQAQRLQHDMDSHDGNGGTAVARG